MLKKYDNLVQGLVLSSNSYKELPEQNLLFLPLYCTAIVGDGVRSIVYL